MSFAGFPPTIAYGATSFVTIDPAAITAPSPIVTPTIIWTLLPIQTSFPTRVGLERTWSSRIGKD